MDFSLPCWLSDGKARSFTSDAGDAQHIWAHLGTCQGLSRAKLGRNSVSNICAIICCQHLRPRRLLAKVLGALSSTGGMGKINQWFGAQNVGLGQQKRNSLSTAIFWVNSNTKYHWVMFWATPQRGVPAGCCYLEWILQLLLSVQKPTSACTSAHRCEESTLNQGCNRYIVHQYIIYCICYIIDLLYIYYIYIYKCIEYKYIYIYII